MKVGEARGIYSSVLKSYNQQKFKLSKQRNELKERMESTPDGKTLYADEAATLDLQYNAIAEKQNEYQDYVDQLMEQWESKFNSVAAKQQDEAAKDYSEEMGKIAFQQEPEDKCFHLKGVVSRKKQMIPAMMEAAQIMANDFN